MVVYNIPVLCCSVSQCQWCGTVSVQKARQQTVFDEWKELEKELDDIGQVCQLTTIQLRPSKFA